MQVEERKARGRAARVVTPRASHCEWKPDATRRDPLVVLKAQAETRQPELVPLRHARMLVSPFTFYRGAAAIMAGDLATTPDTGIRVQCCGDAHLANFGGFQSPERAMVFDINDFDETVPGPWEWDVKRLATSLVIAAHDREFDETVAQGSAAAAARSYRLAMREFSTQRDLEVWYARLDVAGIVGRWQSQTSKAALKRLHQTAERAQSKNSLKAFAKLTERVNGAVRIVNDPPVLERFEDLLPPDQARALADQAQRWIRSYSRSLSRDRRHALAGYRVVDLARKVVGVGSVGTRCSIVLLLGRDENDPLFLQVKEAERSVLEPFVGASKFANQGQRVVEGQRLMQAASDIFLGWDRAEGYDGAQHDFYVRQLWDGKVSADLTTILPEILPVYAEMCGWTLARAHARSGDRVAIAGYLGSSETFDRAIVEFAQAYAQQNARDFDLVTAAARAGELPVAEPAPATGAA